MQKLNLDTTFPSKWHHYGKQKTKNAIFYIFKKYVTQFVGGVRALRPLGHSALQYGFHPDYSIETSLLFANS